MSVSVRFAGMIVMGMWVGLTGQAAGQSAATPPAANDPTGRVTRLGEIVVSASRERNLLATPTLESVSLDISTSTVEEEEIRRADATSWTEALDLAPGVFTEERGRKEKHLSSVRGQIYPYPDYSLNGVWQRSFWEVPSYLPAAAIGRIEVLRSGGAIMVGPNSGLVGAINVVPRRFDRPATILDVQGGSFGAYRASLVHGNRLSVGDYTVGASSYATAGPENENAAESYSSIFGASGWDLSGDAHLEITGFALTGERELRKIQEPGLKSLMDRTEEFSPHHAYGGVMRLLLEHGDRAGTEVDFGYIARAADYKRRDPGKPETENREKDWEYNAGVIHAMTLSAENTVRAGVQYNHWICPDGKRDFVGKRMDVETFSGVVVDEHRFGSLTADAGVRVTRSLYRDYTDTTFNIAGDSLSGRPITDEWGDPVLLGTLGGRYRMNRAAALYAHAALGAADAPPGAVSETSASLERERRRVFDGGIVVESPAIGRISCGLFATFRDDAVLLTNTKVTEDGDTFNTYENSDVRQYGLEIEWRSVALLNVCSLFGGATIMDSEKQTEGDWKSYREIPDVAATAGLNLDHGRFDASVFAKYVSGFANKRFAQDGQYHDLGAFVDLNMTVGVSLGSRKNTRLYLAIENMLDDEYSTVVGYPDYGLQAFAGLQHTL